MCTIMRSKLLILIHRFGRRQRRRLRRCCLRRQQQQPQQHYNIYLPTLVTWLDILPPFSDRVYRLLFKLISKIKR